MKDQAEVAYSAIRDRLLTGIYLPGARLIEQLLCEEIKVNRGDVRQALSRLRAEGLVVRGEKGGFFVRVFSDADIREIYEVRYVLETAAVELIASRATEEDFVNLQTIVEHMALMAENGYSMGVFEADLRFHQALVRSAHNNRLYDLYVRANIPLTGVHAWKHGAQRVLQDFEKNATEYSQIVRNLREGKTQEVIKLLGSSYHWME
jgi:DNA-binding GntR family transcriptional regulator